MNRMYKCIKSFNLPVCDGDGFETGKGMIVDIDTIWQHDGKSNIIGGEIHLDNIKTMEWLEISSERLDECFKLLVAE